MSLLDRQRLSCLLLLSATLATVCSHAHAQQTLRWKFRAGESRDVDVTQTMSMALNVEDQPLRVGMRQRMSISRTVQSVDEQGNARVLQQIKRVQMTADGPAAFAYDSKQPAGDAAGLAPLFQALTQAQIAMTITPRGKVQDVELPQPLLEAIDSLPATGVARQLFSQEGLTELMKQSSLEFPEQSLQPGERWQTKSTLKTPLLGTQVVTTTYTYQGAQESGQQRLAQIEVQNEFAFEDVPKTTMLHIKDQFNQGKILFDNDHGDLVSSQTSAKLTLEVQTAGRKVSQNITTELQLQVQPPAVEQAPERDEAP